MQQCISILLKMRPFFILYKASFSTGLSATSMCRLGFLRREQQEKSYIDQLCSQPPVVAPPPIMCFLFLDVLFLPLYQTISECLFALQTKAGLLSSESGHICTLRRCCHYNDSGCYSTTIPIHKRHGNKILLFQ